LRFNPTSLLVLGFGFINNFFTGTHTGTGTGNLIKKSFIYLFINKIYNSMQMNRYPKMYFTYVSLPILICVVPMPWAWAFCCFREYLQSNRNLVRYRVCKYKNFSASVRLPHVHRRYPADIPGPVQAGGRHEQQVLGLGPRGRRVLCQVGNNQSVKCCLTINQLRGWGLEDDEFFVRWGSSAVVQSIS
jgi:hypothetical protein